MALTQRERVALSKVRQVVAKMDGTYAYGHLCPLLSDVVRKYPHLSEACIRLRTYISQQLEGWGTLESWQSANGFSLSDRNPIRDRLAWIDWMLQ